MALIAGRRSPEQHGAAGADGCNRTPAGVDYSGCSPQRAPVPNTTLCRVQIAAGLRTSGQGRSIGLCLLHAASQTPFQGFSANGMDRSQLPLRGSSGFAPDSLLAHIYAGHCNGTQDIVFAKLRQSRPCLQEPCSTPQGYERPRFLSSRCCRVVFARFRCAYPRAGARVAGAAGGRTWGWWPPPPDPARGSQAFLAAIDQLVKEGLQGDLPDDTRVIYVSPLKALSNDIQRNLDAPLKGIREELELLKLPDVAVRAVKGAHRRHHPGRACSACGAPPHIVVTTPQPLCISCSAPRPAGPCSRPAAR